MAPSSIGASLAPLLQRLTLQSCSPSAPSSSSASSSSSGKKRKRICRIVKDLEEVMRKWVGIKALLDDAEKRQINDELVRLWLFDLRELGYKIEDLRDVYEYEVVAREVEASKKAPSSHGDASTSEVRSSMVTSLSPLLDTSFRDQIARDVERIKREFDAIYRRRKALKLKRSDGQKHSSNDGVYKREHTGHVVEDPVFLGRDQELEQLRKMLLADHGHFEVIVVTGMGGIGKTTLARHVFKDENVNSNFDKIVWVYVSEEFDVIRLIKAVIVGLSEKQCDLQELSPLQYEVERLIYPDKKVLIVMDDVWEVTESWYSFVAPLNDAASKGKGKGSKILVTTRFPEVAATLRAVDSVILRGLDAAEGWSLLRKHASPNQTDDGDNLEELEEFGKEIVRKCGGLPLSIKLLGRLLLRKGNGERDWRKVSESSLLEYGVTETKQIMGSLYLSYLYLDPKLQSCFKHCAIYPNRNVTAKRLKYSLLAHDLVNDEIEAMECLHELESRYFLDLYRDIYYKFEKIRMHDHIYELAQYVLGEKHRDLIYKVFPGEQSFSSQHASLTNPVQVNDEFFSGSRHASIKFRNVPPYYHLILPDSRPVYINIEATKLRTLNLLQPDHYTGRVIVHLSSGQCIRELEILVDASYLASQSHLKCIRVLISRGKLYSSPPIVSRLYNLRYLKVSDLLVDSLPDSIFELRNLRWLSLASSLIENLPEAISMLTNLREINLEGSRISNLPKTISELVNLQKLNLNYCRGLKDLSEGITSLTNIRVLNLNQAPISYMPKGFGALTKLEYLTCYAVSSTQAGLAELKNMKRLKDDIQIVNLHEVASEGDAAQAEMANKKHIRVLFLCWGDLHPSDSQSWFLNSDLEYYQYYSESEIDETYGRSERGNQERDAHREEGIFEQLRPDPVIEKLFIGAYGGCKLPIWMGHQSFTKLVRLHLCDINYCTSLSPTDQLPSLEMLMLELMQSLVDLVPDGIMHPATEQGQSFPKLKVLAIKGCNSLKSLPLHRLTSLERVFASICSNLQSMEVSYNTSCPLQTINIYRCPKFSFSLDLNFPPPSWVLNMPDDHDSEESSADEDTDSEHVDVTATSPGDEESSADEDTDSEHVDVTATSPGDD